MKKYEELMKIKNFTLKKWGNEKSNQKISDEEYGLCGTYIDPSNIKNRFLVVATRSLGWEHVSVSLPRRCPTWEEMCMIKDLFFNKDEWCVEYHPCEEEYVNNHPYCLHIWRPYNQELVTPPSFLVGVKGVDSNDLDNLADVIVKGIASQGKDALMKALDNEINMNRKLRRM